MAGFGSISLAQTIIGTLIDQRAVVLYKQPKVDTSSLYGSMSGFWSEVEKNLYGGAWQYEELFAGLAEELGIDLLTRAANITGTNPYGITYMSANVNVESDLCDHPIETGMVMTDTSIQQPITAQIEVAMPTYFAERIYNTMKGMQERKETKIILQTKYGVYKNLVLKDFSYSLDRNTIDRTIFTLVLREIMEFKPYGEYNVIGNVGEMVNESDSNTVSNGTQVARA